jgi:hypothetical protein
MKKEEKKSRKIGVGRGFLRDFLKFGAVGSGIKGVIIRRICFWAKNWRFLHFFALFCQK